MWLIANGAESFPIQVSEFTQAKLFHALMGLGHAPINIANLMSIDSSDQNILKKSCT
jgi:hypothetical protein